MLDDATVARIASLFRQHPDFRVVFTDAIAEDSYTVDRSGPTAIVYLNPAHRDLAEIQASWNAEPATNPSTTDPTSASSSRPAYLR